MAFHVKIVFWNADGLGNKVSELKHYLSHNNVDINHVYR